VCPANAGYLMGRRTGYRATTRGNRGQWGCDTWLALFILLGLSRPSKTQTETVRPMVNKWSINAVNASDRLDVVDGLMPSDLACDDGLDPMDGTGPIPKPWSQVRVLPGALL
jgi:hypothetical protein